MEFYAVTIGVAVASIFMHFLLTKVKYSPSIIKKIFFIPSPKSTTNAQMLGGLPFVVCTICCFSLIFFEVYNLKGIDLNDMKLIEYFIMGSIFVMAYGYLDDRYEIRPYVKLSFQVMLACFLAYRTSGALYSGKY